jgi:sugar (pentulose or hexulose) kinase
MAVRVHPCFVGCDIGTSAAKAVVADFDGTVLGTGKAEYALHVPAPGRAEQDPEDYWTATTASIRQALANAGLRAAEIGGVALSGQAPVCIPVNGDGQPLGPAHIWMDRRAEEECAWLRRKVGDDRVYTLSGNIIDPYYGIPKILWVQRHIPEVYQKAAVFLGAKDFVLRRLADRVVTDPAHAALAGVAFDLRVGDWSREVLEMIGIYPSKLPEVVASDKIIGKVTADASRATGLPEGTPIAAGTVDLPAALLSFGLTQPGDQVLTLGSSACWAVVRPGTSTVRGMITMPCPWNGGRDWIVEGATVAAGGALRWFADQFGEGLIQSRSRQESGRYEALDRLAAESPPGARRLLFIPYLAGERTPIWDSMARGCFIGLTFAHTAADVVRSILEGVAYSIRHNVEQVPSGEGAPVPPVWVTESGARSSLWREILADVLGVPVAWIQHHQGAALGDAYLAGIAVGHSASLVRPRADALSAPDPGRAAVYESLYAVYRQVYPALRPLLRHLVEG